MQSFMNPRRVLILTRSTVLSNPLRCSRCSHFLGETKIENPLLKQSFSSSSSVVPTLQASEWIPKLKDYLSTDDNENGKNTANRTEISTNQYELELHGRGESFHPSCPPDAIVTPASVDDVIKTVQFCNMYRVPIIPFGTGTSLEGHIAALNGGINLDMKKFDSIEIGSSEDSEFGFPDSHAKVGAGVTRLRLNEELRQTGMHFVVDPGADASIGGMTACGASGTTATKYGTMRENILGLECVLPNGMLAKCGSKALKSSAGYDLTSLMCGSEGTLGVITNVTVKLQPIPSHVVSAVCVFEELHEAAEAVMSLKLCVIDGVARCELLDQTSIQAFNQYIKNNNKYNVDTMEEKPTLFLEFHGASESIVAGQVSLAESLLRENHGGRHFQSTSDEQKGKALWMARHDLYYASLALRPGSQGALITDVCVPLSKLADIITATVKDVQEIGVVGPCFGHAGDGNFHCILPRLPNDSDEYIAKQNKVNENLIQRALDVGGTCTGEHGVGYGKLKYMKMQYGSTGGLHMMQAIKNSLDPDQLFNPGKIIPSSPQL